MPVGDETKAAATSTSDGPSAAQSAAVASIARVTANAASTQRRASPVAVRASSAQAAITAKEVASRGAGAVRAIHAGMGIMAIRLGGLSTAVARIAMKPASSPLCARPSPPAALGRARCRAVFRRDSAGCTLDVPRRKPPDETGPGHVADRGHRRCEGGRPCRQRDRILVLPVFGLLETLAHTPIWAR